MPIRGGTIINIAGTTPVDDPSYRYKMPAVYGKIEGSGNGIKTKIENISDVAMSLHRNPGEVNKFFGCELGAQTTYNEDTDRAIVNGAHTDDTLQKLMHRYIQGFVICPTCGLVRSVYRWVKEVAFVTPFPYGSPNTFIFSLFQTEYSLRPSTVSRVASSGIDALLAVPKKWSI